MNCEMCGNQDAKFQGEVEGTKVILCNNCTGLAKNVKQTVFPEQKKKRKQATSEDTPSTIPERGELLQMVREDFSQVVKSAREQKGLKQKDFAVTIAEKESLIHNIESGSFKPNIELARKLERALGISLIETREVKKTDYKTKTGNDQGFTMADFVKKRK